MFCFKLIKCKKVNAFYTKDVTSLFGDKNIYNDVNLFSSDLYLVFLNKKYINMNCEIHKLMLICVYQII